MATTASTLDPSELLTLREAADMFRTSTDAIRARICRGQLTPIKFGARRTFVRRDELIGLLKQAGVR